MKTAVLSLVLAATASAAGAHSLKDLEDQLGDRERYFQAIDKPAPPFKLRDADGRTVSLADLRGNVVVLNFIYMHCPDLCPLHAEKFAEVQKMINRTPMKDLIRFISITTDSVGDTPDVLRAYGDPHGLDPVNWVFLTTDADQPEDATRALAERFGHSFTKAEDGYQMHGMVTHVIDREGRWRANFHGLTFASTNMVLFVNALTNDIHETGALQRPGIWDRIRSLF